MTVRRVFAAVLLAIVMVIVAVVVWLNFIRADAPDEFELSTSEDELIASTDDGPPILALADLEGEWRIAPGSQAGYRVVEDFAGGIQNFEAVGRGGEIDGALTFADDALVAGEFTVQIASIVSDDSARDDQFHRRIMNAAEFPTATFRLTSPVALVGLPAPGQPLTTAASGELTLRGVTQSAEVALQAQVVGSGIEVVGSVPVLFSDYDIANPSIERVIAVRDEGLVEFQLVFVR